MFKLLLQWNQNAMTCNIFGFCRRFCLVLPKKFEKPRSKYVRMYVLLFACFLLEYLIIIKMGISCFRHHLMIKLSLAKYLLCCQNANLTYSSKHNHSNFKKQNTVRHAFWPTEHIVIVFILLKVTSHGMRRCVWSVKHVLYLRRKKQHNLRTYGVDKLQ